MENRELFIVSVCNEKGVQRYAFNDTFDNIRKGCEATLTHEGSVTIERDYDNVIMAHLKPSSRYYWKKGINKFLKIKDMKIGEEFTIESEFVSKTKVYKVTRKTNDFVETKVNGWTVCFNLDDIVYPIAFSSLDGAAYRP